jgi:hypothetical protein
LILNDLFLCTELLATQQTGDMYRLAMATPIHIGVSGLFFDGDGKSLGAGVSAYH